MEKIEDKYGIPVGSIRTIGDFGNPYVVSDKIKIGNDNKIWVEVEFLESGDTNYYPLNEILLDPKAE